MQLSKIENYLADKFYTGMLSNAKGESKRKAAGADDLVPFWESGIAANVILRQI
jgi:hypothetical protein